MEGSRQEREDKLWIEMYERLEGYVQKFGDTQVPFRWKEDPKLGRWVHPQRKLKKRGTLPELGPSRSDTTESVSEHPVEQTSVARWDWSVGTKVRKEFGHLGCFNGVVIACDADYHTVEYEDGDKEDIADDDLEELAIEYQRYEFSQRKKALLQLHQTRAPSQAKLMATSRLMKSFLPQFPSRRPQLVRVRRPTRHSRQILECALWERIAARANLPRRRRSSWMVCAVERLPLSSQN